MQAIRAGAARPCKQQEEEDDVVSNQRRMTLQASRGEGRRCKQPEEDEASSKNRLYGGCEEMSPSEGW